MPKPHYEIEPTTNTLAFGAVVGTTAGTATTIVTTTTDHRMVLVTNNLNADVTITYNGANWFTLPALTAITFDLSPNERRLGTGKVVGIYYVTAAPTAGRIAVTLM